MHFTDKAKKHIDACRFCWMCHHVCPIGIATGQERNSVRGRALGLSMVARDAIPFSGDIIGNIYECSLCGGCMTDCVTGWDPVMFTKEARLGAALDGKLPDYVLTLVQNALEKGTVYGETDKAAIPAREGGKTLFFLGEDARKYGLGTEAAELLQRAGCEITVLADEPASGYALDFLIGAAAETRRVMEACAAVLNGYETVICYDPADARVLRREYGEWGIDLRCRVATFTETLAQLLGAGNLTLKKSGGVFTPQDSPLLARDLGETEPLRTLLGAAGEVREMLLNREHTMLAGNLIMNEYMPGVMRTVAENRWNNARCVGAETVVTASCADYVLLRETKPADIALMKIEEVLLKCL